MKTFQVTWTDNIEAETEEQAYDELLKYLKDVVNEGDVLGFEFKEIQQ